MFFKKKTQPQTAPQVFLVFPEIAKTLYYGVAIDNTSELSAILVFDEQQRVSGVNNLIVNGAPKVPPMDVMENINKLTLQFESLPKMYKIKTLTVTVKDGAINTNAEYME